MDVDVIKAQCKKWLKDDIDNGLGDKISFTYDDFFFHCKSFGAVSFDEQDKFYEFMEGIKIDVEITDVIT